MHGSEENNPITCRADQAGIRIDAFLASYFSPRYSRTVFQQLIEEQRVKINGYPVKKRYVVQEGDSVEVVFFVEKPQFLLPEPIPLSILYEDEEILLIDKPPGMVVHPGPGHAAGTVAQALLHHCRGFSENLFYPERPGIVHRLDKETSGVLLLAKNPPIQARLMALFAGREVEKEYTAICLGNPGCRTVEAPIGRDRIRRQQMCVTEQGKEAKTRIQTLAYSSYLSLVQLFPMTGRTHQLRVHLRSIGAPILGDSVYGNNSFNQKWGAERVLLHATSLTFVHPKTGQLISCRAPLPDDMLGWKEKIIDQKR